MPTARAIRCLLGLRSNFVCREPMLEAVRVSLRGHSRLEYQRKTAVAILRLHRHHRSTDIPNGSDSLEDI